MRIAYVCGYSGIPVPGDKGPAVHVRELIGGFTSPGHDVTVFAARIGRDAARNLPPRCTRSPLMATGRLPACARRSRLPTPAGPPPRGRASGLMRARTACATALDAGHRERRSISSTSATRCGCVPVRGLRVADLPYVVEVNSPYATNSAPTAISPDARAAAWNAWSSTGASRVVAVSSEVAAYVRARSDTTTASRSSRTVLTCSDSDAAVVRAQRHLQDWIRGSLKPGTALTCSSPTARLRHRCPRCVSSSSATAPSARRSIVRPAKRASPMMSSSSQRAQARCPALAGDHGRRDRPYPALDGFGSRR